MSTRRWLIGSTVVYLVGLVLHTADHIRRGSGVLTPYVKVAGLLSTLVGIVTIVLVLRRSRHGPLLATVFGLFTAFGVTRVHILARAGSLSDPLSASGTGVNGFSWVVVLIEIVGALAMGISGLAVLIERRRVPSRMDVVKSG